MIHIMQLVAVFTVLGLLWTLAKTYVDDSTFDPRPDPPDIEYTSSGHKIISPDDREEIEWP